jgi:hypothetical protein
MTYETASFGPGATNRAKPPKKKQPYSAVLSRAIQQLRTKTVLTEFDKRRLTRLTDALIAEVRKVRRTK